MPQFDDWDQRIVPGRPPLTAISPTLRAFLAPFHQFHRLRRRRKGARKKKKMSLSSCCVPENGNGAEMRRRSVIFAKGNNNLQNASVLWHGCGPKFSKKLTLNMEDIEKTIQTDKMGLDNCFIMAKVECYPRKTHLSPIELTTLMTVNKFATRSLAMNHRLGRSPNVWSRSKIKITILI